MPERVPVVKFVDKKRVLRDWDRALKEERERMEFAAERRRQEVRWQLRPGAIATVRFGEKPWLRRRSA